MKSQISQDPWCAELNGFIDWLI